jgi:Tfp pilus assembly protein PilF
MESDSSQQNLNRRLDSWKEIASFFNRDERTVKRWEKKRALPVHRVPGGGRGGVFAYTEELTAWLSPPAKDPAAALPHETSLFVPLEESGTGIKQPSPPPVDFKWRPGSFIFWGAALLVILSTAFILKHERKSANLHSASQAADPVAEDLYLKGRFYWNKRTPEDLNKAVDYFTQAIVHDPGYSKAYVGLADSYNLLREFSAMPGSEAFPQALAAAKKAVELDDHSAEAHTSLAFALLYANLDQVDAEREFKRAIELDPKNAQAHHWYATALLAFGRPQEALQQIEIAQKLDPGSKAVLADKGIVLYSAGQPDAAVALLNQIEASDPSFLSPHRYLSVIAYQRKDYPGYFAEWKQSDALSHDDKDLSVEQAAEAGFAVGGFHGMVESMLPIQKKLYQQGSLSAYPLAQTYALLGKKAEAFQFLQDAYNQHDMGFLYLHSDSAFNDLHNEPAYKDLMALDALPRTK